MALEEASEKELPEVKEVIRETAGVFFGGTRSFPHFTKDILKQFLL